MASPETSEAPASREPADGGERDATSVADTSEAPASETAAPESPTPEPVGRPWLAAVLAWVVPGLGHLYLRRWRRAAVFAAVVLSAVATGYLLRGELWGWSTPAVQAAYGAVPNPWLHRLLGVVAMGMGSPWFLLHTLGYRGDVAAAGYEYGITFFFTAAIMNWLLVFDAWDVSRGRKP